MNSLGQGAALAIGYLGIEDRLVDTLQCIGLHQENTLATQLRRQRFPEQSGVPGDATAPNIMTVYGRSTYQVGNPLSDDHFKCFRTLSLWR
ncbi:hypothetical protein D3C78_1488070 [compost metagenome]